MVTLLRGLEYVPNGPLVDIAWEVQVIFEPLEAEGEDVIAFILGSHVEHSVLPIVLEHEDVVLCHIVLLRQEGLH